MHLGIGFCTILVYSGYPNWEAKSTTNPSKQASNNDAKKKGTKMANETLHEPTTPIDGGGPGSRGEGLLGRMVG